MLYSNSIGLVHLVASCLALLFGTFVIVSTKGTKLHKRVGYAYAASMLVLLVTAFMIYRVFGGFGLFHVMAIVSSATLIAGMVPVMIKKPVGGWFQLHFNFMYWSVIGLYAAFAAEIFTRIPSTRFFWMVFIATFLIVGVGSFLFSRYKTNWEKLGTVYNGTQGK